MNNESYKIYCESIQSILLVKCYTDLEIENHYKVFQRKINRAGDSIPVLTYQTMVAKCFLEDEDLLPTVISEFDVIDDIPAIMDDIYNGIITIYPAFTLENICNDLNSGLKGEPLNIGIGGIVPGNETLMEPTKGKGKRTLKEIRNIEKYLKDRVIGQNEAIEEFIKGFKLVASGLYKRTSYFFVGPTGVGKTLLTKLFGKRFSNFYHRINCNEFALDHETQRLVGSPPGYIGSSEDGELTKLAEKSNAWLLFFDEIEEASPKLCDLIIGLLEDGEITDNKGNCLDFSESIIVFSSNVGIDKICKNTVGFGKTGPLEGYEDKIEELKEQIKKKFKAKFINRVDNWVYFKPLNEKDSKKIVSLELKNIPVKKTKELISYIVKHSFSREYGAREIKRFIKNKIATPIADLLLDRVVPVVGNLYQPRIEKDTFSITNTRKYDYGLGQLQKGLNKSAPKKVSFDSSG